MKPLIRPLDERAMPGLSDRIIAPTKYRKIVSLICIYIKKSTILLIQNIFFIQSLPVGATMRMVFMRASPDGRQPDILAIILEMFSNGTSFSSIGRTGDSRSFRSNYRPYILPLVDVFTKISMRASPAMGVSPFRPDCRPSILP
jgi:hypothetical protein